MLGLSLIFVATGAILRFAVADNVEGVDLSTIGLILMIVGGVAAVVSLFRGPHVYSRTERTVSPDGRHVVEEHQSDAVSTDI
jgi:hypothetical protein